MTGTEHGFVLRQATGADAQELFSLIASEVAAGRLLPRTVDEVTEHVSRFTVAVDKDDLHGRLVGAGELAPLSHRVAEVRSLVVRTDCRGRGIATAIVTSLRARARAARYRRLVAFTRETRLFLTLGFHVVPHAQVPEKIAADCETCSLFGRCGQTAVLCRLT